MRRRRRGGRLSVFGAVLVTTFLFILRADGVFADNVRASLTCYRDWDGDGYGNDFDPPIEVPDPPCPTGYSPYDTDCADGGMWGAYRFPGNPEVCDGVDNDCDLTVDEGGDALCADDLFCTGAGHCHGQDGCFFDYPCVTPEGTLWCDEGLDQCVDGPVWTVLGSIGAIDGVRAVADVSGIVLAAVDAGAGNGRVYRSTDNGITWMAGPPLGTFVDSLLVAQDGTVFAGTGTFDGSFNPVATVFKSLDEGMTWSATGALAGGGFIPSLLEAQSGALFAASAYGIGQTDVFKSTNGGEGVGCRLELPGCPRDLRAL